MYAWWPAATASRMRAYTSSRRDSRQSPVVTGVGPYGLQVLLGEELGRRHERGLMTRLDHGEGREERHQRLAAADVSLEQSSHRMGPREILLDLGEGPFLRARRAEREPSAERRDETRRRREGRARLLSGGAPPERQAELEEEELVADERAVGKRKGRGERLEVGLGRRAMDAVERARQVDEALAGGDLRGQRAPHAVGGLLDRRLHHAAPRAR